MAFYQADIIEEEVVKQWGTHVSKKYVDRDTSKKVRKASEPFLKVCEHFESLFNLPDSVCSGYKRPKKMIQTKMRIDRY